MSKLKGDPGYRAGWCIHYRANHGPGMTRNETCEAGVDYAELNGGTTNGMVIRLPCFIDKPNEPKRERVHCNKFRPPTDDEVAAHETWRKEGMDVLLMVMREIQPWREEHKGRSHAETIECPACKGRLHLSIAAYNGHVHARCATEDCVSWME